MTEHPKQAALEARMRSLLDALDDYLEDQYGELFSLHPNRLDRGEAGSKSYDGLFSVFAKFSLGYGTKTGRGYLLTVNISTLDQVPKETRTKIESDAARFMKEHLAGQFPDRELHIVHDNGVYKITGDFSLGVV